MPWKGEKDPYKIWLSEVILQQTRVEQGLRYYEKFVDSFPDVHALAKASDQHVYKLWEGLGYYARCRNLIETARFISTARNGNFPRHYEEIKRLKGIGPYTAAAVVSFAFDQPYAVVDGNVFRVLARIFGIDKPVDTAEGKKFFNKLANMLVDKQQPGLYNQAIMDFGAVICKPIPQCGECPFQKFCAAFHQEKISSLPVKSKKVTVRKRWFYYIILQHNGQIAIRQRTEKDIWRNLFEFFLIESERELHEKEIIKQIKMKCCTPNSGIDVRSVSPTFKQQLSHQVIEGRFADVRIRRKQQLMEGEMWVKKEELKHYAFPKFITQYLQKQGDTAKKIHISM
jgi:A/G-specific adenine glycosylase